jgi:hypothetical protein
VSAARSTAVVQSRHAERWVSGPRSSTARQGSGSMPRQTAGAAVLGYGSCLNFLQSVPSSTLAADNPTTACGTKRNCPGAHGTADAPHPTRRVALVGEACASCISAKPNCPSRTSSIARRNRSSAKAVAADGHGMRVMSRSPDPLARMHTMTKKQGKSRTIRSKHLWRRTRSFCGRRCLRLCAGILDCRCARRSARRQVGAIC